MAKPQLPAAYMDRLQEIKKRASEPQVFFSFQEEDETCIVRIIGSDEINTTNGPNTAWRAEYLEGNIHGLRDGSPPQKNSVFRFWESTVLGNQMFELGVKPGDTVAIVCLGEKQGKKQAYRNFYVEIVEVSQAPRALPPETDFPGEVTSPQETL